MIGVSIYKPASAGMITSSGSGSSSHNTSTPTDVTNLSVSITTGGRPVLISAISDAAAVGGGSVSEFRMVKNSVSSLQAQIFILRDSTIIAAHNLILDGASGNLNLAIPTSAVWTIDSPAAGTYTYKVQYAILTGSAVVHFSYVKLVAYEI